MGRVARVARVVPVARVAPVARVDPVAVADPAAIAVARVVRVVAADQVVRGPSSVVRVVRVKSSASAPMASPCRRRPVLPVRPGRIARPRSSSRASAQMDSPCPRSRAASASRWDPMPRASGLTEPLGIPSVVGSGRSSAAPRRTLSSSR